MAHPEPTHKSAGPLLRVLGRIGPGDGPTARRLAERTAPAERAPSPEWYASRVPVLVAVPHAAAREGAVRFLNSALDLDVVAVGTGAGALDAARRSRFRVLLLDAAVANPDAFEVMSRLRTECPHLRILLLAATNAPALPLRALAFGAAGHLDARGADAEYVAAVRAVARGERYLSPLLREALIEQAGGMGRDGIRPHLSAREFQVLRLLAQGRNTVAIADALSIAMSTVRTYKGRLREKLGVEGDAALVRYALEQGIA